MFSTFFPYIPFMQFHTQQLSFETQLSLISRNMCTTAPRGRLKDNYVSKLYMYIYSDFVFIALKPSCGHIQFSSSFGCVVAQGPKTSYKVSKVRRQTEQICTHE
jgi:hypothetical protein